MTARRVFIISRHPILRESVRLLLDHPDIEWVGAISDCLVAKDHILNLRPDIVLFEEGEGCGLPQIMTILKSCYWSIRVANLSLANNHSIVYHREQQLVGHTDDLLRLILSESTE